MREIKFRAWDNKEKNWLLGYEYENLGGFSLYGECVLFGEWAEVVNAFIFERGGRRFEDLKIMQYTGLKDKNGKEIYEGDILRYSEEPLISDEFCDWDIGEVRYYGEGNYPAFDVYPIIDCDSNGLSYIKACCFVEIIGNIYENPELLEVK